MDSKSLIKGLIFIIAPYLLLVILHPQAEAIPYFSREYATPCNMCHSQFPALNKTGMTFKQNGYRLKGEEGKYIWETKRVPLSGLVIFKYQNLNRKGEGWNQNGDVRNGNQSIFSFNRFYLYSGGTIAPRVSYYVKLGSENEKDISPDVSFVIFDDILNESRGNLKIGKFYNEFFYLSNDRRLSIEPYVAPVSRLQYGIEWNGEFQPQGIRYATGIANDERSTGEGHSTSSSVPGQTPVNFKDVSNFIYTYYGWITYTIYDDYTIGIRGYSSKARGASGVDENHTQFDINLYLLFEPASITFAYFDQANVDGIGNKDQRDFLAELLLEAGPQLLLDLRYELKENKNDKDKDSKYIFSWGYYFAPNVELRGEFSRLNGKESGSTRDEDKFQVAIEMAF